jgi:transposase
VEVPSRFEISDELWAEVEPLIPARPRRRRYPGRKAIDDRLVLNGILDVLHTVIAWEDLPREYGHGSGVTCWRRLRTWQQAGVWEAPPAQAAGQAQRRRQDRLVARRRGLQPHPRPFGGLLTGPSPLDRARAGSKGEPRAGQI